MPKNIENGISGSSHLASLFHVFFSPYTGRAPTVNISANKASQSDPKKPLIPVTACQSYRFKKSHLCDLPTIANVRQQQNPKRAQSL
jgi:hypothetical protein